jgi:hypothetical protein
MSNITVLRPDVEKMPASAVTMAVRPSQRATLRLTIIENGKPKARALLLAIAEGLREHLGGLTVEVVSKSSASWPIGAEEIRSIAARSDLVLTGLGDCGGCSANSVADAVVAEQAGIAATAVITEPFQGLVASYASRLGAPGYPVVVLPHPLSSRSDSELATLASKAVPSVLNLLTTD